MPLIILCQRSKDSNSTHNQEPAGEILTVGRVIRIIFVIPIFAIVALLSIAFNDAAIYLKPIEDLYEAVALASFFLLLCAFVQECDEERQTFFASSGTTKHYLVLAWIDAFICPANFVRGSNHWGFSISCCHARSSHCHRSYPSYGYILCYLQQTILRTYLGQNYSLPMIQTKY